MSELNTNTLNQILLEIKGKTRMYENVVANGGVYLRHDIDDNIDRSVLMANLEANLGISGEYFVLNTTKYWNNDIGETIKKLKYIQDCGHRIGWHNNALSEFVCYNKILQKEISLKEIISWPLEVLRSNGLNVIGSASHGSELCNAFNFSNKEIWKEFPKQAGNKLNYHQLAMKDFGIQYEAYAMKRDMYWGDSGGKLSTSNVENTIYLMRQAKTIQITLHPQHWKL